MADNIYDPLTVNLRRQTRSLLQKIPKDSPYVAELSNITSTRDLLGLLSRLLAKPELTGLVAVTFRPILTDLCARWVEENDSTEEQLFAIAFLVEPQEELFPILDRMLRMENFKNGPLGFIPQDVADISMTRLHLLLLAYFRILQVNREIPDMFLWPLMPLSSIIWSDLADNTAKLLAIRCYAMQIGMGEAEKEKLEHERLGESFGPDCPLEYGLNLDGTPQIVDGWLLPVTERERVLKWRNDIPEAVVREGYYVRDDDGEPMESIGERDLSRLVVNVHGVLLLRSGLSTTAVTQSALISTPTTTLALRTLATHISLRLPTLLTSPPSAGKSLLLSHLASLLHPQISNQIIAVHLADTSLDARALLGSYTSSPTSPGTFEWKEGVLVRAMREGRWIIFEDVDKASPEVLGTIRPLIESMRLGRWIGQRAEIAVFGKGKVVAEDTFRVFATRSVPLSREDKIPPPTFLGAHKFWEVIVHTPTKEELQTILDAKYPKLEGAPARSLVHLWEQVRSLGAFSGAGAGGGREVGLRELEKFSSRLESLLPASFHFEAVDTDSMDVDEDNQLLRAAAVLPLTTIFTNPTLREDIFIEARDVFFGAGALTNSARIHAEAVARTVGILLGLDIERQDWLLRGRVPSFTEEKDVNGRVVAVSAGYTSLMAKSQSKQEMDGLARSLAGQARPFAMHKPAAMLLSRIARAVSLSEPVLLTGETGTGKTSAVTHLASLLRRRLVSINLSHQTESSDLIGGFKPVDARLLGGALMERWEELFGGTFSRRKNEKFESEVRKAMRDARWARLCALWRESGRLALDRIKNRKDKDAEDRGGVEMPRKRRKVEQASDILKISEPMWAIFLDEVDKFEVQHVHAKGKFAFGFVPGPLVKALQSGDWILLDEINLASPETLECITGLLHGPTASITLTEQGSLEPVPRHPEFRLFSCMNPATDIGKKDLPPHIRARFTEIDVPPPDADKETLLSIVTQYIGNSAVGDKASIMNIVEFYQSVKALAEQRQIADGANHRPHYSMRTLTRALTFANDIVIAYGFPLRRALWEGSLMAFTMVLDKRSAEAVAVLAHRHILAGVKNPKSLLTKVPNVPRGRSPDEFIKFGPFYLERGPYPEDPMEDYIITPSVESKLIDLARIVLTRRFPVLIEGPTSSGKTSSVEYLAKRTGHRFVRINNHEHTDIQEYIGSYVSDPLTGKLVFKDGLLVRALRNGDWIVLDELNLAPTDVLEALNRLLDDNRELLIPETQEVVKPHPHFMLFATQNPPGLYAGRKILSRAFRNRFLEVHFEDVPQAELETILCQRCRIAPSYGKKIVAVFHELQKRRQTSRVFESKHGFATLRDLFRWAGRDAIGYQELAENGYMLIGERARREDDKAVVKEVIENIMGVRIDEKNLYDFRNPNIADMDAYLGCPVPSTDTTGIGWTTAMQRLFILVSRALKFNEPVLLVGETGTGKTSVCQVYADAARQRLLCLNCHQNTETADLIGGLRPIRNRTAVKAMAIKEVGDILRATGIEGTEPFPDALSVAVSEALKLRDLDDSSKTKLLEAQRKLLRLQSIFEWHDGPLIEAMRNEDVFLLDEISLADDSVLERLNSVLETSRTIVLAEKGGEDSDQAAVKAERRFKLVATMNPGGDYGKKELSPALRNRFTEIWVPPIEDRSDLELIVGRLWESDILRVFTKPLLDFTKWLCSRAGERSLSNLRDILAWVAFMNCALKTAQPSMAAASEIFHHAAHMTFLDGLGSMPHLSSYSREAVQKLKGEAETKLEELVPFILENNVTTSPGHTSLNRITIGPFSIPRGLKATADHAFNIQAPTTHDNSMRIVRACQLRKPILLEGSPGVGKTSLVTALANLAGHQLHRINLSDQTDLIDLFGSDLPVEGGSAGEFAWRDAEFLRAMQEGHWVLLDEMNLAPQAVLEGLNAVLDHRGAVYVPELGRSFQRHDSFRIFAAQNPVSQGGGRKGLPKSFVNRFTKVYVEELSPNDLFIVCQQLFPELDQDTVRNMIKFNMQLTEEVCVKRSFGQQGSPWEFNLRDVIRWGHLLRAPGPPRHPADHLRTVYLHRFRTKHDRLLTRTIFDEIFGTNSGRLEERPPWTISPKYLQFGYFGSSRKNLTPISRAPRILNVDLPVLESIGMCVSQSWLTILTGNHGSGKTEVVRLLAHFTGNVLQEISINSAVDTMDILGSFEQVDHREQILTIIQELLAVLDTEFRTARKSNLHRLQEYRQTLQRVFWNRLGNQVSVAPSLIQSCLLDLDSSPLQQTLLSKLNEVLSTKSNSSGRFEWVDGPLIDAMKKGHWLLLDNANLCNPSVLDRLNSLCEPDGFLTLNERGLIGEGVQLIKPHPDFKLFMTVDPQHGELSRAMRNRGIEISLIDPLANNDSVSFTDYLRFPEAIDYGSWNVQCIILDHTRRGLRRQQIESRQFISSSARALDHESALSYVIDDAPLIIRSSLEDRALTESHLYFAARTTVPRYASDRCRSFTGENADLGDLQKFLMGEIFASLRDSFAESRVVSSDFAFFQPMDFYLVNSSSIDKATAKRDASTHHTLLKVLNFGVALFLLEKDFKLWSELANDAPSRSSVEQSIFEAISGLMGNIRDSSQKVLRNMNTTNVEDQTGILELITRIIAYGRGLRSAVHDSVVDHSALISLAQAILDALRVEFPVLLPLHESARHFGNAVSLSSGLGLLDIWTSLYSDESLHPSKDSITRIGAFASSLSETSEGGRIRRRTLDYLALATLGRGSQAQKIEFQELGSELEQMLSEHGMQNVAIPQRQTDTTFLTFLVLRASLLVSSNDEKLKALVKEMISSIVAMDKTSLLSVVPYQQLVWSMEVGTVPLSLTARMHLQWLHDAWDGDGQEDPSLLSHPVLLSNALRLSDWRGRPMASLDDYESQIIHQARMTILQCQTNIRRSQQLPSLLYESLCLLAQCFSACLDIPTLDSASYPGSTTNLFSFFNDIVSLMENYSHRPLAQAVRRYSDDPTSSGEEIILGKHWVALGFVLFDLLIPCVPIDPAIVESATFERLNEEVVALSSQIALHRKLEEVLTGNPDNMVVQYLLDQLESASKQLSRKQQYPVRKDVPRLHMYWSEVAQFRTQVLTEGKIIRLFEFFKRGKQDGQLQEQVIQQSIEGFYRRLDSAYADFEDINLPLKLSMLYVRLGLRLAADAATQPHDSRDRDLHQKLATALVGSPSFIDTSSFFAIDAHLSTTPAVQHVILQLAALCFEVSLGIDATTKIDQIDLSYQTALRLWLIDRAKEKQQEKEASSLYRTSATIHNEVSEAELEEREFLAIFPSFEDVLSQESTATTGPKAQPLRHVQSEDATQIVSIHFSLTGESCSLPKDVIGPLRRSYLDSLIQTELKALPAMLDDESLSFQLSVFYDRLLHLRGPEDVKNSYDFYSDANVSETKKALVIVDSLKRRLDFLIHEWPEQMVLQHLRDKCAAFLALEIGSPVAKLLTGLEQLLIQTEDWELYANKENTLKSHRQDLTNLIIAWRQLELSSWRALLDSQMTTYAMETSTWWFRLYEACIYGSLNAGEQELAGQVEALSGYLDNLIPLLDDFMFTSSLGQFQTRLQLLRTFERYLLLLGEVKLDNHRTILARVQRVLNATVHYFSLYSPTISKIVHEAKAGLEKEIQEYIKLASWKDINVQALKASAQRTHHRLFKVVRKFREVLKQPVRSYLAPALADDAEGKQVDEPYAQDSPNVDGAGVLIDRPEQDTRPHLSQLRSTFTRFNDLISTRIRPVIRATSVHSADNLAIDVINTARELSGIVIPNTIPPEKRVRQHKALLVRKRKAWSDLLKELKRIGLSPNPKPIVLLNLADERWLREQPILHDDENATIKKIEVYFSRLRAMMPRLRASLSNHHSDISTRELGRGTMLLESGYRMAIDLRSRLADAVHKFDGIKKSHRRLEMLVEQPRIVAHGRNMINRVRSIKYTLCRLSSAFHDIYQGMKNFNELKPHGSLSEKLLHDVEMAVEETAGMRNRLIDLVALIPLTAQPLLLADEYVAAGEGCQQISRAKERLQRWAQEHPQIDYLLRPAVQWIETQDLTLPALAPPAAPSSASVADNLIDSLLVAVQSMLSICPDQPTTPDEVSDHFILQQYQLVRDLTYLLTLDPISTRLEEVIFDLASRGDGLEEPLQRVKPFLDIYLGITREQLDRHCQLTKALFKLNYVVCSILLTVAEQGFCKPPDASDTETGEEIAETSNGVGLGAGAGAANVSKEIEDESQVEGLKDEKAEEDERNNPNDEGDAIEMGEDIGGEMEDVPDEGTDDEVSKSDEESEGEPEERLGKLDASDPSAIDEKLWGDEKGPEKANQEDGKTDQNHEKQKSGESDVVAKEGEAKEGEKESERSEEEEEAPKAEQMQIDEDMEEEGQQDSKASGAPLDDHIPEADTLDLPDDLNLEDQGTGPDEDFVDEAMEDEGEIEGQLQDAEVEEAVVEHEGNEVGDNQSVGDEGQGEGETMEQDDQEAQEESSGKKNGIAQADVSAGEGGAESTKVVEGNKEKPSDGQATADGGEPEEKDMALADDLEPSFVPESVENQQQAAQQSDGRAASRSRAVGFQQGEPDFKSEAEMESNPLRSLGDALKEIRNRFDEILQGEKQEYNQERLADTSVPSQVEYLHPNEADHDMQALGPAGEEQVAKLEDLKLIDDGEVGRDVLPMNVDSAIQEQSQELLPLQYVPPIADSDFKGSREDTEGAMSHGPSQIQERLASPDLSMSTADIETEHNPSSVVEAQLKEWQASGFPEESSERIWRLYESLTHELAYALCEQLRLILEPTLATRLRGDYRTGKRLNMKKIIPYIASDYTKDKIWLRRTRPSQREYQVLIAIDDSRSMAESHSVHLAYQTLALVAKALSRLESGDIAIAKFGEAVHMLHNFDEGQFTDQAGTKVISSFRFNQKATNVLSLVEASLKVLETARERRSMSSATAGDLWQLEIIISDGLCQDHDRLRTLLRKAEEQRVMVVFVIVDSLHSNVTAGSSSQSVAPSSILNMDKAEYKLVDGRMELQLHKYLDSFPFEYYVVLRDVEALPDVLAGTLKQFFERISES